MNARKPEKLILSIVIIVGCMIMIYPLLWMFSSSFKEQTEIFGDSSLWPSPFTFDNYVTGWSGTSDYTFGTFFLNTLFVVSLACIGNMLACSMAAYAFARLEFIFRKVFFAVMLMTLMLPFHVTVIPQYILFDSLGWINTYWPLILPKFLAVEGFFIFLMVQFIRSLPRELDQAAQIDGCGQIQIYWRLIIPLALPALMTVMIFTFIWTWNDFFSQLLYLSDIRLYTVSLGLRMFLDSTSESAWGPMFAMSTLSLIPVFVVFIFFQRYLIEGITTGGVKG